MKKKLMVFTSVIFVALVLIALPLNGALAKKITLRMQSCFPPEDQTEVLATQPMLDAMEKACEGKLRFRRFMVGTLSPMEEMLTAVGSGAIDFAQVSLSFYGEIPQGFNMIDVLPFAWNSQEDLHNIFYEHGMLALLREVLADLNVYVVGVQAGPSLGWSVTFPVESMKDFKGKKIFAPVWQPILTVMGATAVNVPPAEFYMALKLGTIDGISWSFPELETMKLKEAAHYVVKPFIVNCPPQTYIMNMDRWKSLPPDVRQKMEQVIKDMSYPAHKAQQEATKKIFDSPEITVCELPPNDAAKLKEAATKMWEDEVGSKGPMGRKAIDILKAYYRQ